MLAHVMHQGALVQGVAGVQVHDAGDGLAPLGVGQAHHQGVGDAGVGLQRLLHLFREDFSPAVLMQAEPRPSRVRVPSGSTRHQSPGME